jgi:hypothetical protein
LLYRYAEERRVAGAAVPTQLCGALLRALDTARWPPVTHRRRVDSERYLVVTAEIKGGRGGDSERKVSSTDDKANQTTATKSRMAVDPYLVGLFKLHAVDP